MTKIIFTLPGRYSATLSSLKQISVVVVCSFVMIGAVCLRDEGIYELVYGIGCCGHSPAAVAAAVSAPPYVIAIDPGHGGMDTGAQAIVEEYKVIDTTCAYLYELLENDPDFIPVLTRTDTDPESGPRADVANSAGASLLLSIHANSDSHQSSKGFECFPQPPGRAYHTDSLHFAQLIVEQMLAAGHTIRGDENKTGIKYAYYYGDTKKIVDSSDDKLRSRKSFGILEKANCPAVLAEQCFISNYSDVENWATDAGCQKAARLYYTAIKQYFDL